MSGTIQLLHKGNVVQSRIYDCETMKNGIIDSWKKIYGKGYSNTTLNDIVNEFAHAAKSRFTKGDLPKTYKPFQKIASAMRKEFKFR